MRILTLIVFVFLISCKSSEEKSINTSSNKSEDLGKDPISNPLMGGPTDLKITLTDAKINGAAKIIGFYLDQRYLEDSVKVTDGFLHFTKPQGVPQGLYYVVYSETQIIQIIMDEDQKFEMKLAINDIINTIQITGSDDNSLMYETSKYEMQINPKIIELAEKLKSLQPGSPEYNQVSADKNKVELEKINYLDNLYKQNPKSLFMTFKYGGQNPRLNPNESQEQQIISYRNGFWDMVDFSDRRLLRTPMIGNKLTRYIKELTIQQPDSILVSAESLISKVMDHKEYYMAFVNWIMVTYEPGKSTLMDAENIFSNMAQKYVTHEKAFWADSADVNFINKRAMEMSASLIGKPAPNVISTDQNGKQQELLSKKADYLVVYLYNPDCDNCQKETPLLHDFYQQNKNKGIDVFAIAVDTEEKLWKDYIQKNKLSWTNVYDPTNKSIYAKYFVDHTPEIYLINKDRKIIGKNLKTFQIQTMIDKDKAK